MTLFETGHTQAYSQFSCGHKCSGNGISSNTNVILLVAWMHWAWDAVEHGRTVCREHRCSGNKIRARTEETGMGNTGMVMDALGMQCAST